jgi:Egh16-like virulence factor
MQLIHALLISTTASLVAGHAALVTVGTKNGLGVTKTTNLGTGDAIRVSTQDPCGPNVNLASLSADDATPLNSDGTLSMSVFQVNGDGAGPFNVAIDTTGTGKSFDTPVDVTTQVPGTNGVSGASEEAFPLDVKVSTNVACTGGTTGNLCLVQVKNPSGFGGCGVIQQGAASRRAAKTAPNRITPSASGQDSAPPSPPPSPPPPPPPPPPPAASAKAKGKDDKKGKKGGDKKGGKKDDKKKADDKKTSQPSSKANADDKSTDKKCD